MAFRIILALLIAGLAPLQGKDFPKGSPSFYKSHTAGLAEAKRTGKPIIMVVSADWCPHCQGNLNKVFPDPQVARYHDAFIWVYLDSDDKANRPALTALKVQGIPHFSFFAWDGLRLGSTQGSTTPAAMAGVLKQITEKHPKPKEGVAPSKASSKGEAPSPTTKDGEALLIDALKQGSS